MTAGTAFGFASAPRPVKPRGGKGGGGGSVTEVMEPQGLGEGLPQQNIMSDRRVVRGSTYGLYRRAPGETADGGADGGGEPGETRRRRKKGGGAWREKSIFDYKPPSDSREELDLSAHLIEAPKVVVSAHVDTQTDGFAERPPPMPMVPKKTGVDAHTTMNFGIVSSYAGEDAALDMPFNFDLEVHPLLEVLVGKTLEQSLLEVEQEEELAAIADAHAKLVAAQRAEAARIAGLEKSAAAQHSAAQAKLRAARARAARERELARKVACVRCMAQVTPAVVEDACVSFEARDGTTDPLAWVVPTVQQIRALTLPWLYEQVTAQAGAVVLGDALVDAIAAAALADQMATQKAAQDAARAAKAKAKADAEAAALAALKEQMAREGWMRCYVNGATVGAPDRPRIGPLKVNLDDDAKAVEEKVRAALAAESPPVEVVEDGFAAIMFAPRMPLGGAEASTRLFEGSGAKEQGIVDETILDIMLPEREEVARESADGEAEEDAGPGDSAEAEEEG